MEQTEKTVTQESTLSTPDNDKPERIHRTITSFLCSKKLWMTVFGLLVLWFAYWKEINYLYSFTDPNQILAFTAVTRDFMFAFTAAVLAFLGVEGAVSWKHGTESVLNQAASFIQEKSDKTETINNNTNYNEHITEEGVGNASVNRPFGQLAYHEDGYED